MAFGPLGPKPFKSAAKRLAIYSLRRNYTLCRVSFRHWLGLGSAKRLVIYALLGLPLKNTSLKGIFPGTASALEAQKAQNLHAFWALVNNYLFERPFFGNASALEAQQACNSYGFWASVKKSFWKRHFSGVASALDAPNGS